MHIKQVMLGFDKSSRTQGLTAMGKKVMGKMRNAESKMWNQKCGMTLIGRGDKPRDRGSP